MLLTIYVYLHLFLSLFLCCNAFGLFLHLFPVKWAHHQYIATPVYNTTHKSWQMIALLLFTEYYEQIIMQ